MPRCSTCKCNRNESLFKKKANGSLFATCTPCSSRKRQPKTGVEKENHNPSEPDEDEDSVEDLQYLGKVPLSQFLNTLASLHNVKTMTAQVDLSSLGTELSLREKADILAKKIWEELDYRLL